MNICSKFQSIQTEFIIRQPEMSEQNVIQNAILILLVYTKVVNTVGCRLAQYVEFVPHTKRLSSCSSSRSCHSSAVSAKKNKHWWTFLIIIASIA